MANSTKCIGKWGNFLPHSKNPIILTENEIVLCSE